MMLNETQDLLRVVQDILPRNKYRNIEFFRGEQGAQRATFTAEWGPEDSVQRVFIKADKNPEGLAAIQLKEKGCGTARDVRTLGKFPLDESVQNGISPLIDFYNSEGLVVSVEPEFSDSLSLRRRIQENGILSRQTFESVFEDVFRALHYASSRGIYHRDLSPSNILVRENGTLEARVTDWSNSGTFQDVVIDESFNSGPGARLVSDPLLSRGFVQDPLAYSIGSEVYSLGINALVALTGNSPVYYDYVSGKAIDLSSGESLLSESGKVDRAKHDRAVETALAKLPKGARRHRKWIRKALSVDSGERYTSIQDVLSDFEKAKKPSLLERIVKRKKEIGVSALVGGLVTLAAGIGVWNNYDRGMREKIKDAERYNVSAKVDGRGMEVSNNLVQLKVNVMVSGKTGWYPQKDRYLSCEAGDKLNLTLQAKDLPREIRDSYSSNLRFLGRAYLEGVILEDGNVGIEFNVNSQEFDDGKVSWGYSYGRYENLDVPHNIVDGVYTLAIEIYPPVEEGKFISELCFDAVQGKVLARKRIPIVVGDVTKPFDAVSFVQGDGGTSFGLRNLEETDFDYGYVSSKNEQGLTLSVELSDEHTGRETGPWGNIWLPVYGNSRQTILYFHADECSGEVKYLTAVPLSASCFPIHDDLNRNYCTWDLAVPPRDFAERIVAYKQELEDRNNQ